MEKIFMKFLFLNRKFNIFCTPCVSDCSSREAGLAQNGAPLFWREVRKAGGECRNCEKRDGACAGTSVIKNV